jgi:alkyl sulfatase BDS1-like metallo-beta-lactamase superfamily hydrolase
MTIVEGDSGIIVIDPLEAVETSRAGLALYSAIRGERPVKAVIYTHSHVDHFGGVRGVISDGDLARGVTVLAPDGFVEAAISENVYAGTAMARRASYMYGVLLPRGERGLVSAGLANAKSQGTSSFVPPNDVIRQSGETRTIDGVAIEFQLVSGTEAPAEMTLYFPQFRVLDSAEIACPLLHNIVTLRGAQVRDAKKWAESLNALIALYGDRTDALIAQHAWPRWRSHVTELLSDQRDLYKYMHDQTLHWLNQGYTASEIAEKIQLPDTLSDRWYVRGYYGTLSHDVKAIYQRYLGWFDGNPANLNPLPPVEAARKSVDYMGGPHAVTAKARQDFRRGEYRWVAQVMNQVVFAFPEYVEGRHLQADALEQLGYQAESGVWRNFYLTAAKELREGPPPEPAPSSGTAIRALPTRLLFDYWGVLLDASKANGRRMVLNWTFTDGSGERYALNLSNNALTYREGWLHPAPDASFTLARTTLDAIVLGQADPITELRESRILATGDPMKLVELLRMLVRFKTMWPIVTP